MKEKIKENNKTMGDLYSYSFSGFWGRIVFLIKEFFWFLLIGFILLFASDLKIFLFFAFFIILYMFLYLSDPDNLDKDIELDRFLTINNKINLIAYKLKINHEDIHNYLMAEIKDNDYGEVGRKRLARMLEELLKSINRTERYKEENK